MRAENNILKDEIFELKTKNPQNKAPRWEPKQSMVASGPQTDVRASIDDPAKSMSPVPEHANRFMHMDDLKSRQQASRSTRQRPPRLKLNDRPAAAGHLNHHRKKRDISLTALTTERASCP